MSRKLILTLAAAASVAAASVTLGSSAVYARGMGGGMGGGHYSSGGAHFSAGRGVHLATMHNPGRGTGHMVIPRRPGRPIPPVHIGADHQRQHGALAPGPAIGLG